MVKMGKVGALQNYLLICLMLIMVLAQQDTGIEMKADVKPPYRPSEDHTLMFPMLKRDYSNWGSLGSAVFLTNKAVIAPEASNTKGLIYTTQPNPFREHWYALIDFNIGRDKVKELNNSGEGFAIYYVKDFDAGNPGSNQECHV